MAIGGEPERRREVEGDAVEEAAREGDVQREVGPAADLGEFAAARAAPGAPLATERRVEQDEPEAGVEQRCDERARAFERRRDALQQRHDGRASGGRRRKDEDANRRQRAVHLGVARDRVGATHPVGRAGAAAERHRPGRQNLGRLRHHGGR